MTAIATSDDNQEAKRKRDTKARVQATLDEIRAESKDMKRWVRNEQRSLYRWLDALTNPSQPIKDHMAMLLREEPYVATPDEPAPQRISAKPSKWSWPN